MMIMMNTLLTMFVVIKMTMMKKMMMITMNTSLTMFVVMMMTMMKMMMMMMMMTDSSLGKAGEAIRAVWANRVTQPHVTLERRRIFVIVMIIIIISILIFIISIITIFINFFIPCLGETHHSAAFQERNLLFLSSSSYS